VERRNFGNTTADKSTADKSTADQSKSAAVAVVGYHGQLEHVAVAAAVAAAVALRA
jgi:hypothetical protein